MLSLAMYPRKMALSFDTLFFMVCGLPVLAESRDPFRILPSTPRILEYPQALHLELGASSSVNRRRRNWSLQCMRCTLPQS